MANATVNSNIAATVPFIPDNAPFSPEQRSWLNGFLAGLYSAAPGGVPAPAQQAASLKIAVLYASQSGTGEGLAKKVAKELKSKGHAPVLAALESYALDALAAENHAIIVASTYGEGDPPDNVCSFYDQLCADTAPRLDKLSYAMLALGDRHYEHFCKFGIDLDLRLRSLGAEPICERVECDVDVAEPFAQWKADLLSRLDEIASGSTNSNGNGSHAKSATAPVPAAVELPQIHTRDRPLLARMIERRALTHDVSSKLTMHVSLSIDGSELHYQTGDACGVIAQNDAALIHDIFGALHPLGFTGTEAVQIEKIGEVGLFDALTNNLVITQLNRKMLMRYAEVGKCSALLSLLAPEQQSHLDKYTYDRGLVDLLTEYPGVISTAQELVDLLPRLAPRLYSISSSPIAHPGEIHNTIAVVRYRSHNRERGGICSSWLAERVAVGDSIPIYIQPNKKFRLPVDTDAPIIMIGPGTGIAPFRAFLHERRVLGAAGKNWLFFGERKAATDFLYREELESMVQDGHITRLDTAFSRDQEHKIYVQDRMLEQADTLWAWLKDGASIYVCGDASRMAKDVDLALNKIVETKGGLDPEAASEYIDELKDQHRYHRDVY